ncbi:Salicylate hydroxylase [Mycena sanguinolenta]|uniref:Salicylate hydroxylase n=1 Tax=Mycena sanguinolenta TaxID=230812 RepID=A0A8H6XC26_9AGAR|nr:Salicylate hydroxylase [Mycena sanguinolenta]
MHVCHGAAFARAATLNAWPFKEQRLILILRRHEEWHQLEGSHKLFSATSPVRQNVLHRTNFPDELVTLFPAERAHFKKNFPESTIAEADAVVGCDGIHSKICAPGAVPMKEAVAAVGEKTAKNATFYVGLCGPNVKRIPGLTLPELNVWAIFEMGNPLPTFTKGRLVLRRCSSPYHDPRTGFATEDNAALAEFLADERVKTSIEAAVLAFNDVRRERDHWLMKSSSFVGDCVEGMNPDIGGTGRSSTRRW